MVREADKLTLGQDISAKVPHAVMALMNGQRHKWLSSSRMAHYQGVLCDNPGVSLETLQTLNAATYLPAEEGPPDHDCEEVIDKVYSSRPDLTEVPLSDPELELFTARSSFIREGQWKAGFAVTPVDYIIQAEALPQGGSAQRTQPWALIQALRHAKGKRGNVYTDSRYAFATLHVHGAIYKERGPWTAGAGGGYTK